VVSRNYFTRQVETLLKFAFTRQVETLLKFAKTSSDPKVVTTLVDEASELKSQADEALPTPDLSPLPPDVERPNLIVRS
jgi:hypothetical protein